MIEFLSLIREYSDKNICEILNGTETETKTYGDYYRDISGCAARLNYLLRDVKDRHIGILASCAYDYMVLIPAVIFSRAVAVPLNFRETTEYLAKQIEIAKLDTIIVENADEFACFEKQLKVIDTASLYEAEEMKIRLSDFSDEDDSRDALIIFTSGTTSTPKGVVLTVGNLFRFGRKELWEKYSILAGEENNPRPYNILPLYHVGGITSWLRWAELGWTICVSRDVRNSLDDIAHSRIDIAVVSPAFLKLWIKSIKRGKLERLGGVKYIFVGGATLEANDIDAFLANGITIVQVYGMTETCGTITVNTDMDSHRTSVGKAAAGASLSIIDGEICADFWGNMKGYYGSPKETAEVLQNGIIHTGDLGYIDEDGYVYITGRKKNVIILSGGENISPEELEAKLNENEQIVECRVRENKDRLFADVFAPNASYDQIKEYIANLNASLPIFKRIYGFELRETELEKTANGKIKRQ